MRSRFAALLILLALACAGQAQFQPGQSGQFQPGQFQGGQARPGFPTAQVVTVPNPYGTPASYGFNDGVQIVLSVQDFWSKFMGFNGVYVDDPAVAGSEQLNDLANWLRNPANTNHHWSVIILGRLDPFQFANDLTQGVQSNQDFNWLTTPDATEQDATLIVIGGAQQHARYPYDIKVYTSPYFDDRNLGESSADFTTLILPEMHRLTQAGNPTAAVKFCVIKEEALAAHANQVHFWEVVGGWTIAIVFAAIVIIGLIIGNRARPADEDHSSNPFHASNWHDDWN